MGTVWEDGVARMTSRSWLDQQGPRPRELRPETFRHDTIAPATRPRQCGCSPRVTALHSSSLGQYTARLQGSTPHIIWLPAWARRTKIQWATR